MIFRSRQTLRGWTAAAFGAAGLGMALAGSAKADEPRAPAEPAERAAPRCLSEAEIREEVAARRIIPQVTALRAARAAGGGEAVRARVCRGEEGLFYAITALKRDGKVLRIELDAATGRLLERN